MNLRNTPIDKRRLKKEDRSFNTGSRQQALAKTRARRGNISRTRNTQQFSTEKRPGTGGFTGGIGIQQQRLRDVGNERRRAEGFRPEGKSKLLQVEDPIF
tara:strand:- start:265 stop:564 length:300 start_codon:yes stop_codon:yes gene_type:complete